ncbi:MAG: hypothetical protein MZV63_64300 [Marinilabiliales bacterium]|nr:hypothetical protein [Marinilabiliales bacterium]
MSGDRKAYTELLNRYRDSVYYVMLRMVNNPSDAEDLTIEAFGKAFHNIVKIYSHTRLQHMAASALPPTTALTS